MSEGSNPTMLGLLARRRDHAEFSRRTARAGDNHRLSCLGQRDEFGKPGLRFSHVDLNAHGSSISENYTRSN